MLCIFEKAVFIRSPSWNFFSHLVRILHFVFSRSPNVWWRSKRIPHFSVPRLEKEEHVNQYYHTETPGCDPSILSFLSFAPRGYERLNLKENKKTFSNLPRQKKRGKCSSNECKKETLQFTEGHMYSLHLATVFSADQAVIRRIKIMRLACAFNNLWHRVLLRHKRYYPTNPSSTFWTCNANRLFRWLAWAYYWVQVEKCTGM